MATAAMGLRRRVASPSKRPRADNNNSPSQGNLNSLQPPSKKTRSSVTRSATAKARESELKKVRPPHWSDPRPYAQIAGLSLNAQAALCSEAVSLPPPLSYSIASFVGASSASSLGKSYLDIGGPPDGLKFLAFASRSKDGGAEAPATSPTSPSATTTSLPDSMFNAYQPWVIKTYGDLAKTKTITIKKYARILRTLRGEEANSAENSKFRFWVKSKGFHIGQPEGYDAKPADRIIGRHAVTEPGLDPPLYVPTQPPHNKNLNGAEGTVPGKVYKKVAIVENFFDIIHAVHVDLEGRPGKHAGQKRTYRTITETYAFLPREAVTRFLLGCTECQRRPRTPSPTSLAAAAAAKTAKPSSTPSPTPAAPSTPQACSETASSPKPATGLTNGEAESPTENGEKPKEEQTEDKPKTAEPAETKTSEVREEKYNPLSITNLLRKDPVPRRTLIPHMPEPEYPTAAEHQGRSPSHPLKMRLLQEGAPWSSPIDYSQKQAESDGESCEPQRSFSPAAGLIDTNLNLLATIQQLHCQVMLALTQRLRPPVSADS